MAWNDAPPKPEELKSSASAASSSWASAPPTTQELNGGPGTMDGIMDRIGSYFSSGGREDLKNKIEKAKAADLIKNPAPKQGLLQTELEGFGNGATLGYLPHLQALAEPVTTAIGNAVTGSDIEPDSYLEDRDRNIKRLAQQKAEHPINATMGNIVGGLAMAPLGGESQAASGMGRIAHAAKIGAKFGAVANPGDKEAVLDPFQIPDRVMDAGTGMAIGAGTGAGLEALHGARTLGELLRIHPKANAEQIEAAAKALGITPTSGMLNDSQAVQDMESSLHQSPTVGGALMRRETAPVGKGMRDAAKDLFDDANGLSPDQAGTQAKAQIQTQVNSEFQPHKDTFQDLQQYTKDINAPESSRNAVSRNVMNIPEVQVFKNDAPAGVARDVVSALGENPSADMIKRLKTMVGTKAASAEPADQGALWQIYAKLSRLEENTIKRGVIDAARNGPEGNTIAEGMLGQLKGARQGWKAGMDKLGNFSDSAGLSDPSSPDHFLGNVGDIQNEKMQQRLFNPNDNEMSTSLKESFPNAYSTLRGGRLTEMKNALSEGVDVNPSKLLNATKKNAPEANAHLFGSEGTDTLNNLRTVDNSLPDMVGPSGTPKGEEVKQVMNPLVQASGLARYAGYKALTSDAVQGAAKFLSSIPKFSELQVSNPQAFNAMVLNFAKKSPGGASPMAADNGPRREDQAHYDPGMERAMPVEDAKNKFLEGN